MDEKTLTPMYSEPFQVKKGCLFRVLERQNSDYSEKLSNFAPYITREITQDDGLETTTRVALRGLHESGKELPEIEIDAAELAVFNWLPERWGMDCILEVGRGVKDVVRYAIQTTARHAERQTVYTVTGWRKLNGQWVYLITASP